MQLIFSQILQQLYMLSDGPGLDILQKYRPTLQTHITHITFYSKNLHEIAIWMKNNSYEAITTTFNKHKSQKVLYTGCFIYEHIQ